MKFTRKDFGRSKHDQQVELVTLNNGYLAVSVINYGASVTDLRLLELERPLVLGFHEFASYEEHHDHFGAIVGRVANRIASGKFRLQGQDYQLPCNEAGHSTLHGGAEGFSRRVWRIAEVTDTSVTMFLHSVDGDNGFPGELTVQCSYRLVKGDELHIELKAAPTSPTLINLSSHIYYNFSGTSNINKHLLQIPAKAITSVNDKLHPDGQLQLVAGSNYDFTTIKPIGDAEYDINYTLAKDYLSQPQPVARLESKRVKMIMLSNAPGLQVYSSDKLNNGSANLHGRDYTPRSGICLEPQAWPDAPNHPHFPNIEFSPDRKFSQLIILQLRLKESE